MKIIWKIQHINTGLYANEDLLSFDNQGYNWSNFYDLEKKINSNNEVLLPRNYYAIICFVQVQKYNMDNK